MTHKYDLPFLACDGHEIDTLALLGEGGSKTVLEVSVDGMRRAIAIPNSADTPDVRGDKWCNVLKEPKYASYLRSNGLLVNPEYEVTSMLVDGEMTEVLSMVPFSELPFKVIDSKHGTATHEWGPLSHIEHFEGILPAISNLRQDIQTLAQLRVVLHRDSVSFAMMPDGSTRFFLFDLEGATINTQVSPHRLAAYYAETAVHKLDNVFDFEQIQRFESQGYTLAARTELAKMLVGDELLDKAKAL